MDTSALKVRLAPTLLAASAAALALIAGHEGLGPVDRRGPEPRAVAYADPVGIPTICHGHTAGVFLGQKRPLKDCEKLLAEDAGEAGSAIASCTTVDLTQAQYDALVSFVFNVGGDAYCHSTLLRRLNAGDCRGAADQFRRWTYAGGRRLPGLVARREDERRMFVSGCPS